MLFQYILSSGKDGCAVLWELASGKLYFRYTNDSTVEGHNGSRNSYICICDLWTENMISSVAIPPLAEHTS